MPITTPTTPEPVPFVNGDILKSALTASEIESALLAALDVGAGGITIDDTGLALGEDSVVEKGTVIKYTSEGMLDVNIPLDTRYSVKYTTDGGIKSQKLTIQPGETLYVAVGSNPVDKGDTGNFSYQGFEIDHVVNVIDVTTTAFDRTAGEFYFIPLNGGDYTGALIPLDADGSASDEGLNNGISKWSDGGAYTNNTGAAIDIIAVYTYYFDNGFTDAYPGLIGLDAFLYLSKTKPQDDPSVTIVTDTLPLNIESVTPSTGSSFAFGKGLISRWEGATAIGTYNVGNDYNNILEVGNGTSSTERSNALEVTKDGVVRIPANAVTGEPEKILSDAYKPFTFYNVTTLDELYAAYEDINANGNSRSSILSMSGGDYLPDSAVTLTIDSGDLYIMNLSVRDIVKMYALRINITNGNFRVSNIVFSKTLPSGGQ